MKKIFIFLSILFTKPLFSTVLDECATECYDGIKEHCIYTKQLILDPTRVEQFKQDFAEHLGYVPNPISSEEKVLEQTQYALQESVGTSEYIFEKPGKKRYFHTAGVIDCITLVAFNTQEKKSVLFHVSKMDIRPNEDMKGANLFEKYFLPCFQQYFKDTQYQSFLISSVWSQDTTLFAQILKKNNILITGMNIPDVVIEFGYEGKNAYHQTFVSSADSPYKNAKTSISTAILFDTESGNLSFSRY